MKGIGLSHTRIQFSNRPRYLPLKQKKRSVPTVFNTSTIVVIIFCFFIFIFISFTSHGPSQGYPACGHIICFLFFEPMSKFLAASPLFHFSFLIRWVCATPPRVSATFFSFFFSLFWGSVVQFALGRKSKTTLILDDDIKANRRGKCTLFVHVEDPETHEGHFTMVIWTVNTSWLLLCTFLACVYPLLIYVAFQISKS